MDLEARADPVVLAAPEDPNITIDLKAVQDGPVPPEHRVPQAGRAALNIRMGPIITMDREVPVAQGVPDGVVRHRNR